MTDMQDFMVRVVLNTKFREGLGKAIAGCQPGDTGPLNKFLKQEGFSLNEDHVARILNLDLKDLEKNHKLDKLDDTLLKQLGVVPTW